MPGISGYQNNRYYNYSSSHSVSSGSGAGNASGSETASGAAGTSGASGVSGVSGASGSSIPNGFMELYNKYNSLATECKNLQYQARDLIYNYQKQHPESVPGGPTNLLPGMNNPENIPGLKDLYGQINAKIKDLDSMYSKMEGMCQPPQTLSSVLRDNNLELVTLLMFY